MKRLLCLALALMLTLAALPALAEMSLNPDQWTEPFDFTAEDYCAWFDTLYADKGWDGWQEGEAPKGYRAMTYVSDESMSDITLLADAEGRVLAIGTEVNVNLADSDEATARSSAFTFGMLNLVMFERMAELDGDVATVRSELGNQQNDMLTGFHEAMNEIEAAAPAEGLESYSADAYKDVELAGHHLNILVKFSMADMSATFRCVFSPMAAQPE